MKFNTKRREKYDAEIPLDKYAIIHQNKEEEPIRMNFTLCSFNSPDDYVVSTKFLPNISESY